MSVDLDAAVERLLAERPMRASEIGDALWGREGRKPQHYCLPAGKLLRRMEREGRVRSQVRKHGIVWYLVEGRARVD